ncbi:MAG TPA: MFS transporter [Fontimonas sp.]
MNAPAALPATLPKRSKIALGLGSAAFGIKDQGFSALLMLYYNQVIGLPATWVGFAILLATLFDAIADPLIGQLSDRTRSRFGRRHLYMFASAIPIAIAYALVWMPPEGSREMQFVYLVLTSILARVAISFYEVPSAALTAELTSDYDERTSLTTYRFLFQALGLIGMGVVVFKLFLRPTPEQPIGQLNAGGYMDYGLLAAVIMLLCVLTAARGTYRYVPMLTQKTDTHLGGLAENLRTLATDRTYMSVIACIFCWAVAVGVSTTLGSYVLTYLWKLDASQLGSYSGAAAIGLVLGIVVSALSGRFSKRNVAIASFAVALVASVLMTALRLAGVIDWEGAKALPYLMVQNAVVYMGIVAGNIMGASMLADVADSLDLKTGRRMEGLMFAALIMIMKAVSGMGVFASGLVLSAISFPEKADPATVDAAVVYELGMIFLVSFCVLVGLAILSMLFYPITRQIHERTLLALRARAANAGSAAS